MGTKRHKRGNTADRRRRKFWLLRTFGNDQVCHCVHCSHELTYATLTVDRIIPGGSYSYPNIQPSCQGCNSRRGNKPDWKGPNPWIIQTQTASAPSTS